MDDEEEDDWPEEDKQRLRTDLLGAVRLYRQFGLFQDYQGCSDVEVAETFYEDLPEYLFDPDTTLDPILLALERTRAWMIPEQDADAAWALACRSAISQGTFMPEEIVEDRSKAGVVTISFRLRGQEQVVRTDSRLGLASRWCARPRRSSSSDASVVMSGSGFGASVLGLPGRSRTAKRLSQVRKPTDPGRLSEARPRTRARSAATRQEPESSPGRFLR